LRSIFLTAGAVGLVTIASRVSLHAQEVLQDVQTIIMEGNVVMPDGTPPPKSVGIERICSDVNGDAPGPTTDKKGHYTWTQAEARAGRSARLLHAGHADRFYFHPVPVGQHEAG
jgi:hypothetical protein